MPNSNGIQAGLVKVANFFVVKVQEHLNSGKYPKQIAKEIAIGTPVQSNNATYIDVTFSAPQAGAFEYGSGLRGRKRQKYKIEPDTASMLAFDWPEAQNIEPGRPPGTGARKVVDKSGRTILPYVMHPGIAERPYIRPTIARNKDEFVRILGKEFKAQILFDVPKVTVIQ